MSGVDSSEPYILSKIGPVVDISIGIPMALKQSLMEGGEGTPDPIRARALIDTGSTCSVINAKTVKRLGLHPVGLQTAITGNNDVIKCHTYRCCFKVGKNIPVEVTTICTKLDSDDFDCLIGLDILDRGLFVYNGKENTFSLEIK